MKDFSIKALSSASEITYSNDIIRIVSDDSNYLYKHHISQNYTSKTLFQKGAQTERIIKFENLDLELITETEDSTKQMLF